MKDDVFIGNIPTIKVQSTVRKPGRPRAIPAELEQVLVDLYRLGYGYRAIATKLRNEYHINPDFSTVKRYLKRLGILLRHGTISNIAA
jgi:hypothetical protein